MDPDFLPIRIRKQEKKSDPDPDIRTRIRNTGFKPFDIRLVVIWNVDSKGVYILGFDELS